jgi:hypothetical protein
MTIFQYEFKLEPNELRFVILRSYFKQRRFVVTAVLPLIPAWLFISKPNTPPLKIFLILLFSYLIIIPLRLWVIVARSYRDAGPLVKEPRLYEFKQENLMAVQHSVATVNTWNAYSRLHVTKRFLYLEIRGTNRAIAIPKRIFPNVETCDEFVAAVSSWIAAAEPGPPSQQQLSA